MSISWCVFEGDIDFDSLTAVFEHHRQPRTGPETFHRHFLATPSEPLSASTVWGMKYGRRFGEVGNQDSPSRDHKFGHIMSGQALTNLGHVMPGPSVGCQPWCWKLVQIGKTCPNFECRSQILKAMADV